MKKIFALLIGVVLCFSFCACQTNNKDTTPTTSSRDVIISREDLKTQVLTGKIDVTAFGTGSSLDTVRNHFLNLIDSDKDIEGQPTEHVTLIGENEERYEFRMVYGFTFLTYQDEQYYFVNGKESLGVAAVVSKSENGAFGFKIGNCPEEDIVNSLGQPDASDVPAQSSSNIAVPNNATAKRLTYNFDNYRLDFMLADYNDGLGYNLAAVILTDTNIYSGYTSASQNPTESTIG